MPFAPVKSNPYKAGVKRNMIRRHRHLWTTADWKEITMASEGPHDLDIYDSKVRIAIRNANKRLVMRRESEKP